MSYTGGPITLTAGSANFSVAFGVLLIEAKQGDIIEVTGGRFATINTILTNTTGTLLYPWPSPTVTAQAAYAIHHVGPEWSENVSINENVVALLDELNTDATDTSTGVVRLATLAEAQARTASDVAITPEGLGSTTREKQTADRTYYVRMDGNDANNGLTDSPSGAFKTYERVFAAVNSIDANFLHTIVHFGPGDWMGGPYEFYTPAGSRGLDIEGAGSSLTRISLWSRNTDGMGISAMTIDDAVGNNFAGLMVGEHSECVCGPDVVFASSGMDIYCYDMGAFTANASYSIKGTKNVHYNGANHCRYNQLGNFTITAIGTVTFLAFFYLERHSHANWHSVAAGTFIGPRLSLASPVALVNGDISTIPGNSDGGYDLEVNSANPEGVHTPVITGSISNPTVTYINRLMDWAKVGPIIHCQGYIEINTISGGSGDIKISLPFPANNFASGSYYVGNANSDGVNWGTSKTQLAVSIGIAEAFFHLSGMQNNAVSAYVPVSGLANGDYIAFTFAYRWA